jgi:hypothetical protein
MFDEYLCTKSLYFVYNEHPLSARKKYSMDMPLTSIPHNNSD